MEKTLWNAFGVLLFVVNILAIMFCLASRERMCGLALVALAGIDWLYKENRPVWIEV